jgi:hypothetical protein
MMTAKEIYPAELRLSAHGPTLPNSTDSRAIEKHQLSEVLRPCGSSGTRQQNRLNSCSSREFIEAAARCYVHAFQDEQADIPGLVDLYAKIDRMRVLSSTKVVDIAERFAQKITDNLFGTEQELP